MKIEVIAENPPLDEASIGKVVDNFCQNFPKINDQLIVEIQFVTPQEMQQLNQSYRAINSPTDVLSFPQPEIPGESAIFGTIIICEDEAKARKEAITELVKHGLLHLAGYDHECDSQAWSDAAKLINHQMG